MSNLADVTPYEADSSVATDYAAATAQAAEAAGAGAALAAAALAVGTIACAQFLLRQDEHQQSAARTRRQLDRDLYARSRQPITVALHTDLDALTASARTLGFRPVAASPSLAPNDRTTPSPILLQNAAGERLVLQPYRGRVVAATNRDLATLHRVVHQHSLLAATRHLAQVSGQPVRLRNLPGGAVELHATERTTGQPGGAATLTVRVAPHGATVLDISRLRGNRCEQILADYARAIGGQARHVRFKPEHADPILPGEAARVRS